MASPQRDVNRLRTWLESEESHPPLSSSRASENILSTLSLLNRCMDEQETPNSLPRRNPSDLAKQFVAEGLGEVACRLALRFPNDEKLQEKVLDTLTLLCNVRVDDLAIQEIVSTRFKSNNSSTICSDDCDDESTIFTFVLKKALENHKHSGPVQSSALCLLGAAGQVKAAAQFLLKNDAARFIETALRINYERATRAAEGMEKQQDHTESDKGQILLECSQIATHCLMAVWNFCFVTPPQKSSPRSDKKDEPIAATAFLNSGLVEGILETMRIMPKSEDIAHWGSGALSIVLKHEPRAREIARMFRADAVADQILNKFSNCNWIHFTKQLQKHLHQKGWTRDADPRLLSRSEDTCKAGVLAIPSPSKRRRTQRSTAGSHGRLLVSRAELCEKYVARHRFKEIWQILQAKAGWHGPHRNPDKLGTTGWLYCSKSVAMPQASKKAANSTRSQDSISIGEAMKEGINAFSDLNLVNWLVDDSSRDGGLRAVQISLCNLIVDQMRENEDIEEISSTKRDISKRQEGHRRKTHRKAISSRRQSFESEEVLWAKLGHHPWWPAR